MREIKFNYLANYKDGDGELQWYEETLDLNQIESGDWSGSLGACFVSNPDNVYKRQYTGLKDKNGKEIYEGDVVVYRDISGSGKVREFSPRPVSWLEERCEFSVSGVMVGGSSYEVIGNIYENPDLI